MLMQYNCAKKISIKGTWFKITCDYTKVYLRLFKKKNRWNGKEQFNLSNNIAFIYALLYEKFTNWLNEK